MPMGLPRVLLLDLDDTILDDTGPRDSCWKDACGEAAGAFPGVLDLEAAQAVGIAGVWVDAGGRGFPGSIRPAHTIRSLADLLGAAAPPDAAPPSDFRRAAVPPSRQ
jgi:hypothetical protein